MQSASAAWLAAAASSHVTPVLYVELVGVNTHFASRATFASPLWVADAGLIADSGAVADETRTWRTLLAPFEQAMGRISHALDDRSNASRISGTSVQLLNQGKLSDLMDSVVLDNCAVQLSLGFEGLGPEHHLVLLRGVIDDYSWAIDALQLDVTDDSFRVHKNLSQYVGGRYFPGTPRDARGKAIPIAIGRQTNIEAIPVQGDATGTLAFAMGSGDEDLYLTEFDAPLPASGSLNIAGETSVTYSSRLAVVFNGISYLRLSGLVRGAPTSHAAGDAVTLTGHTYQYVAAYELGEVTAVRAGDALVSPASYTVTLAAEGAESPVTLIAFASKPTEPVTVDADGINVDDEAEIANGDFETGDATGWTEEGSASLAVTAGDTASSTSTYKGELTGSEGAFEGAYAEFATIPERFYTVELRYRDSVVDNLVTNADFADGLTGWTLDPALLVNAQASSNGLHAVLGAQVTELGTFRYGLVQDVTTAVGETYTFQFAFRPTSQYSGSGGSAFRTLTRAGWRVGTPTDPVAYAFQAAEEQPAYSQYDFLGNVVAQPWRTSTPVTFVATETTTRLTIEAHGMQTQFTLLPLYVDNVQLTQTTAMPTSDTAYQLGTPADPDAYAATLLPRSYSWSRATHVFQASDTTTRLTLRSKWTQIATPSHVDNVRLLDAGRNPADAIAYVIDTYLPLMVRHTASFDDAYARLRGWQFGAYLPDPGESKALLERMADQCKSDLITTAEGETHLVTFDEQRPTVATFTVGNIFEDTFSAHRETLDNLYTEVYVYFGLRSGASRTSPESYQGVTYATPDATTHPDEPLDLLCSAAQRIFRRTRRLDVFADMIRDLDTANRLLSHKVITHTTRHDEVALATSLAAAPVQVADMVAVSHPWLHSGQPQFCQVRERSVRGIEVSFGLRTVRQAGFYEPWEPPAMGTPVVAHHETWAPTSTDFAFTFAEHWEPVTYTASEEHYETWES
jgi:hypothetical protein